MRSTGRAGPFEGATEQLISFTREALAAHDVGDAYIEGDGRNLIALWSGSRAFVMITDDEDEVGVVATDPSNESGAVIAFTLGNGQVDLWPAVSTIERDLLPELIERWSAGERSPTCTWDADPPRT